MSMAAILAEVTQDVELDVVRPHLSLTSMAQARTDHMVEDSSRS